MLDRIARARAKARAHVWKLIEDTTAGFPWLAIAGKTLTGWLVIDMDATLVTASSDKEGAAPTWKNGLRLPPAGRLVREYPRVPGHAAPPGERRLEHVHRPPGSAGRRPPAGPRPVPAQVLVRVDGAGASHELIKHLLSLSSPRQDLLFTCGWMITPADEDASRQPPRRAWKPGITQDGAPRKTRTSRRSRT